MGLKLSVEDRVERMLQRHSADMAAHVCRLYQEQVRASPRGRPEVLRYWQDVEAALVKFRDR